MLLRRQFPYRDGPPTPRAGTAAWRTASMPCIYWRCGVHGAVCRATRPNLPGAGLAPADGLAQPVAEIDPTARSSLDEHNGGQHLEHGDSNAQPTREPRQPPPRSTWVQDASTLDRQKVTGAAAVPGRDRGAVGIPYKLMAGLASAGAAETSYLTLSKLLHTEVACPTSGCVTVLSSAYSVLFGLPLPLYGMLAYSTVAALAVICDNLSSSGRNVPRVLNMGLVAGSGVLASVSASLMYVLHTALGGTSCVWCYASAGLSFALLTSLLASVDSRLLMDSAGPGLSATTATVLALYAGFGPALAQSSSDFELPYNPPVVTTESPPAAVALAMRLRDAGAKMYGAFWCSHCFEQKQAFGREAMAVFPYVECYPDGWKRGVEVAKVCSEAGVRAFPTWVINGTVTEGEMDLDQLRAALGTAEQPQIGMSASQPAKPPS